MKIGTQLPFTLKNKHRITNLKFDFKKVPFWTPKKFLFGFWRKPPQKLSLCFGFDSALKQRRTNVLLVGNLETKVIDRQKCHFSRLWQLITILLCDFNNANKNNICASFVFKAKTKEKYEENLFNGFYFKTDSALKTIDAQMSFRSPLLRFWIWTSKIIPDLWLLDLSWPIAKYFCTPPYSTVIDTAGIAKNILPNNSLRDLQ